MKTMFKAIGLSLIAGSLWAACMGPFCYDDTGAAVNANIALQSYTVAQATSTVFAKGTQIFCSNCGAAGNAGTVCVSTAAVANSLVLSTGTVCK